MKKFLVMLCCALLSWQVHTLAQSQPHPPKCGIGQLQAAMIAKDPTWADRFAANKAAMQGIADKYIAQQQPGKLAKTAATISAVPVVFHIIVDSSQFLSLGGTAGIMARCDSQIAVLNRDYNRGNADSTAIPSSWKSLYGTPGIHFGLARTDPGGECSPGYEIKIATDGSGYDDVENSFPEAKTASTGLAAWDVTRYMNVWCINYAGQAQDLLGLTVALSYTQGTDPYPVDEEGICIRYNLLGCTAADGTPPANTGGSAGWYYPYNLGRTLTHEVGHFFEIWHPWGDDGPGNYPGDGYCPWSNSECSVDQGYDDGLSDTPPEMSATYGNPSYTIAGGTLNDCCKWETIAPLDTVNTQPIGIPCLSYMDYTDDDAMHLFTTMQAAAMASMVLIPSSNTTGATGQGLIGENYSLTQHPELLVCTTNSISTISGANNELNIFPNPTTGPITITLNSSAEIMNQITVINIIGQTVMTINGQDKDYYSIDLSVMDKGVYFIKCNFASGSITRKILLQ